MRRIFTIASLIILLVTAKAKVPDDTELLRAISNQNSPLYYPNLMMRYRDGKQLSEEEYFHLYYGFAFSEQYHPLNTNQKMDRVQGILARLSIDQPSIHDLDELILATNEAMEHDPFSPKLLNILIFAYGAIGDKEREEVFAKHLEGIFHTIESSGDGLKEKSAMHILMFSHAEDLIASKGWKHLKGRIISRSVEFLPFDFAHNKVKGYYFDYSRIYRNKPEGYVFHRDRTWQFNNLKPRTYK